MSDDLAESTVVVILDQRDEEVVGFDFVALPEANKVSGIWNLEPGAHFMYIKTKEEEERRLGEFVYLKKGELRVYRRAEASEGPLFKQVEEYSNQNYKESIIMGHLKNKMSKIPQNLSQLWSNITDCINSELIVKLRPINKVIKSQTAGNDVFEECGSEMDRRNEKDLRNATMRVELSDTEDDESKTLEEYKQIAKNLRGFRNSINLKELRGKRESVSPKTSCQIDQTVEEDYSPICYSDIPASDSRINRFKEITPEMLTSMHMDTSYVLESMSENYENNKDGYRASEFKNKYMYVLGELQYSFILFLLCFNFESLQHYKRLLRAFCNAEATIIKNQELVLRFLKTLKYHVEIWDEEHDVYQEDDFLAHSLGSLREIIVDNEKDLEYCRNEFKQLDNSFKLKFGISLDDLDAINNNYV
ncbi:uncharacterized protein TOT_010000976 [Theileria orientalis strain Shintoku]|uniref:AAR2 protein n=1 Tax=Theileria orientalis strain Shintoku TaxID=869250 RepID=J4C2Y9_THEOR|nr:uncharacterized protein TOT_010000976 [Theileria orientalis strain Shintoku]BAM39521.1 uncharacterized protein TOT_010000976 [Theileria orientalis strain Shintoku]|eukprot:XP_009689822.1 uncharacterized protein TOT_010000976 [Theileria orientalis strain Shintoku]